MTLAHLNDWNNFYVIVGSSAAALTGLTFVVIALIADIQPTSHTGVRAFLTPTIVHFGSVLALAAFMCVPQQSILSLSVGFGLLGAVGCIYIGFVAWHMAYTLSAYSPARDDWIFYVILPLVAYLDLLGMGVVLRRQPDAALDGAATAAVWLLFNGIRNAWDIAVWMTVRRRDAEAASQASPGPTGLQGGSK
jgi:hypothetical protein